MRVVVGLGNPGPRYRDTRHNLGFRVVECLAREEGWRYRSAPWWRWARGRLGTEEAAVVQPLTFMNDSGRAVGGIVEALHVPVADLLVVCDDLDLTLGQIRVRRGGSSGGHKGLASVGRALGTEGFARLKLGVGPRDGDAVEYVLSEFSAAERATVAQAVTRAVEAVRCWATRGMEDAMNEFNRRAKQPQGDTCDTV